MTENNGAEKEKRYFGVKPTVCLAPNPVTYNLSSNNSSQNGQSRASSLSSASFAGQHGFVLPVVVPYLDQIVNVEVILPKFALVADVVEAVSYAIGVQETWFFGITLANNDGVETLLPKERKLIDLINFNHDYQLSFAVHFYPEKVSQVVQTICVDFIYSEVVKKVNQGVIKLPINILHDLAAISLAVLFPFGDGLGHLPQAKHKILPVNYPDEETTVERIKESYQDLIGKCPTDLKRSYLLRVETIPLYGQSNFGVTSKQGTSLTLSVCATGVALFRANGGYFGNTGMPLSNLMWSDIKSISYKDCKLSILLQPGVEGDIETILNKTNRLSNRSVSSTGSKSRKNKARFGSTETLSSGTNGSSSGGSAGQIVVWAPKRADIRQIMYVCSGNHELYLRFRRLENSEMKALRVSEERNTAFLRTVFEKYLEAAEYISSLKNDITILSEEKGELEKKQEASFAALHRVQTAAQLIEANSSVCIEENGLLRAKCAELEARAQIREHARSQSAQRYNPRDSARVVESARTPDHEPPSNQFATEAQTPNVYVVHTDVNHNFVPHGHETHGYPDFVQSSGVAANFAAIGCSKLPENSGQYPARQQFSYKQKASSEQELRPTPMAAKFMPQNSFNIHRPAHQHQHEANHHQHYPSANYAISERFPFRSRDHHLSYRVPLNDDVQELHGNQEVTQSHNVMRVDDVIRGNTVMRIEDVDATVRPNTTRGNYDVLRSANDINRTNDLYHDSEVTRSADVIRGHDVMRNAATPRNSDVRVTSNGHQITTSTSLRLGSSLASPNRVISSQAFDRLDRQISSNQLSSNDSIVDHDQSPQAVLYQNFMSANQNQQLSSSLNAASNLAGNFSVIRQNGSRGRRPLLPDRFGHVRRAASRDATGSMNQLRANSSHAEKWRQVRANNRLSASLDRLMSNEGNDNVSVAGYTGHATSGRSQANRSNSAFNMSTRPDLPFPT